MAINYLVTGGAGFIGSCLVRRLLSLGHQVVVLDNLSSQHPYRLPEQIPLIIGNTHDPDSYKKLPNLKYDAVFHIAGQSSGEASFDNPVGDLHSNAQSVLVLHDFCRKNKIERLLFASTMGVYGLQKDIEIPIDETCDTIPISYYAVSKLAGENYVRLLESDFFHGTALRLFNVYGPRQNLFNMKKGMLAIYYSQAIRNKHILVKGSPDRFRDFVFVEDVVDAFIACENNPKTYKQSLNVATGIRRTVKEVLEEIQKSLPFEVTLEFGPSTQGDQFGIFGNSSRLQELTTWKPKTKFSEGIKTMTDWALNLSESELIPGMKFNS